MSKYRIIKLGNTESYKVQEKILGLFWVDKVGETFSVSLSEARDYVEIFKNGDKYRKARKAKNTIVPNKE